MLKVSTWIPYSSIAHSMAFDFPEIVSVSVDRKLSLIDVRKLICNLQALLEEECSQGLGTWTTKMWNPQRMLLGFGPQYILSGHWC